MGRKKVIVKESTELGSKVPKSGIVPLSRAKTHPEEFPVSYDGLKMRRFKNQWPKVIVKLGGSEHPVFPLRCILEDG